jgi:hypothetical protein
LLALESVSFTLDEPLGDRDLVDATTGEVVAVPPADG